LTQSVTFVLIEGMIAVTQPSSSQAEPTSPSPAPPPSPESFVVNNPATGEVIRELPNHSRAFVLREMETVRRASTAWAALPIHERCKRILKARDVIHRRMDEIAKIVSSENGKVLAEAYLHDVGPTLSVMNFFGANAERILAPERIHLALAKHRRSYVSYQPRGVIGVITPWNFPFFMPGSDVAMSLIAGNGVLLKPSEITPLSALVLKECYDEGGIDPDLFRVVTGLGATGAALIEAQPDHVVFTGSVPTGRRIAMACAERMISYTLELGGKAPAVVLEDADLERTANAIVWGGFANAGQVCASVERVYAVEPVYEELVRRVGERAQKLRVGPPSQVDGVDVGSEAARDRRAAGDRRPAEGRPYRRRRRGSGRAEARPVLEAHRDRRLHARDAGDEGRDLRPHRSADEGERRGGGGPPRERVAPRPRSLRLHRGP
jgi:acyl-CoA reductase-like NAD-dependent aldehyde dehydrogenase